jgi:hypothetical protein
MQWNLVNYNGKLAVTFGWSPDYDQPIERRDLWVSPKESWDEHYYSQYTQVRLGANGVFWCYSTLTCTEKPLHTQFWKHVQETREVKMPSRGGKNWKWVWRSGRWVKQF